MARSNTVALLLLAVGVAAWVVVVFALILEVKG